MVEFKAVTRARDFQKNNCRWGNFFVDRVITDGVMMPAMNIHPAPSLDDLKAELARAEVRLLCDDMIDDFDRRKVEMAKSRAWVDDLRKQIKRIEESF